MYYLRKKNLARYVNLVKVLALLTNNPYELIQTEVETILSHGNPDLIDQDILHQSQIGQRLKSNSNSSPKPNLFPTYLEKSINRLMPTYSTVTSPNITSPMLTTPNTTFPNFYHSTPLTRSASLNDVSFSTALSDLIQ